MGREPWHDSDNPSTVVRKTPRFCSGSGSLRTGGSMPDVEDQANARCSRAMWLLAGLAWVGLTVVGVVAYGVVHGGGK